MIVDVEKYKKREMTLGDYEDLVEEVRTNIYKRYNEAQEKWGKEKVDSLFLSEIQITSKDFTDQGTPQEMKEMLDDFMKKIDDLPYHIDGKMELSLYALGSYIQENHYFYWYRVLKSEEDVERLLQYKIKGIFEEILKPDTVRYVAGTTCQTLSLYKEGHIDFKTLQKLVYVNCSL
ncbi:MAG: hypothetical protein U9R12_06975 [Candidatus Caldatribacteriota bacterium]|nr:hypothetical protein [Candidatus Caldatribacteriota bacterium]